LTLARSTISGVCVLCPGAALVIVLIADFLRDSPFFRGVSAWFGRQPVRSG
jgi:hypothetical protein